MLIPKPRLRIRIGVLNLAIPLGQRARGTPQPAPQLVQEQPRVRPPQEVGQHRLGLARAALQVDCLEDGDDVF
jgi:hypothetical protein